MGVTLRDFMSSGDVLTVEPSESLATAARRMSDRNVGAAVVVDQAGHIAGIFTERDLLRAVADGVTLDAAEVGSLMTANPITLRSDHAPSEAAAIMDERKFRHIPVVDEGELVGIVSIRDLVGAALHIESADAHVGSDFP